MDLFEFRLLLLLFCLLLFSTQTNGKPTFIITFDSYKCTVNPAYADPPTCYFNDTAIPPRGYVDIQMHREVKTQRYELIIEATVNKRKRTLLHMKQDSCKFFEGSLSGLLRTLKSVINDFGTLPEKCPTDKNFRYLFKDIVVDASRLPSFLFECDFLISTKNTEGKELIFYFEARGKLRRYFE